MRVSPGLLEIINEFKPGLCALCVKTLRNFFMLSLVMENFCIFPTDSRKVHMALKPCPHKQVNFVLGWVASVINLAWSWE